MTEESYMYLARSGLPALSRKTNFPESHIINPLLTKFDRSRWLDIGLVLFFASLWTSTPSRSIKTQKKEFGQYPAILTSHLVNKPYTNKGSQVNVSGSLAQSTERAADDAKGPARVRPSHKPTFLLIKPALNRYL